MSTQCGCCYAKTEQRAVVNPGWALHVKCPFSTADLSCTGSLDFQHVQRNDRDVSALALTRVATLTGRPNGWSNGSANRNRDRRRWLLRLSTRSHCGVST